MCISYSHDSEEHHAAVLDLARRLSAAGLDTALDRQVAAPVEGAGQGTRAQLERAEIVLAVCTPAYRRGFDGGSLSATGRALVPVLFRGAVASRSVPASLRPFTHFRLPAQLDALVELLLGRAGARDAPVLPCQAAREPATAPRATKSRAPAGARRGGVTIMGDARVTVGGHLVGGDLILGGSGPDGLPPAPVQCHTRRRPMDPLKALESLLLKMFSADELRRLLRYLPEGEVLSAMLPGPNASLAEVVHKAVEALGQLNVVNDPVLWQRLIEARERRKAEIDAVRALFAQTAVPAAAPPGPGPAASSAPPTVLTIMFASASPEKEVRLRVDKEFRQVTEKLRGARHRDRFRLVQISALRFEDLRTALLEHKPHVLHLSCHGEPDGSLKFESGTEDDAKAVPKKKLLKLLRALGSSLRLVVFNACHSAQIACDVPPTISLSIGMNDAIYDSEAVEFSVAFYEALGFGETVQTAFDTALASLDEDDEVPELYPAPDQDPEKRRQQPLVAATSA